MGEHFNPKQKNILQINEKMVKDHLGDMVRSTVEETFDQMLDADAGRFCIAEKYERSIARR